MRRKGSKGEEQDELTSAPNELLPSQSVIPLPSDLQSSSTNPPLSTKGSVKKGMQACHHTSQGKSQNLVLNQGRFEDRSTQSNSAARSKGGI